MTSKQQILIVDDEINILRAIKRLLIEYNFEIFTTTSSEEALEIIRTHSIDLIISDQRMPEISGIELLLEVKVISPATIRILMSGYTDLDVFIAAINNGSIFYFITKPWVNEEMIEVIIKALNTKRKQDEQQKVLNHLLKDKTLWEDLISKTKLIRRRDFLNNIIQYHTIIDETIMTEAKDLDMDLSAPMACCLISFKDKYIMTSEMDEIISYICLIPNCFAWECRRNIGVVFQADTADNQGATLKAFVGKINETLNKYHPYLQFIIGVSNINIGTDSIKQGYHQADSAILTAQIGGSNSASVYYFRDIGVLQLLSTIHEKREAKSFVEDNLGKLIHYDSTKGTELVHTLEALLICYSLKEAAAHLFIHPKTLVFRRSRIEEILEVSLDSYETKLSLGLAIKLYKINNLS